MAPNVGGVSFPYDPAGKRAAKEAAKDVKKAGKPGKALGIAGGGMGKKLPMQQGPDKGGSMTGKPYPAKPMGAKKK